MFTADDGYRVLLDLAAVALTLVADDSRLRDLDRLFTIAGREAGGPQPMPPGNGSMLTPREREVLVHVADGGTNETVAAELGISAETVQSHVRNAMSKLDASTRTHAVATAIRRSLID